MAKGKKSKGKHYVSKGQRPNVSQKLRNAVRSERVVSSESLLQRARNRALIIAKPLNDKQRELKVRYLKENEAIVAATRLYNKYSFAGMTKAAAMHAAKSNKIKEVEEKWAPIAKKVMEDNRKKRNADSWLKELS